jgi:hypothetical protein
LNVTIIEKNGIEKSYYHAHCELTTLGNSTGLDVIGKFGEQQQQLAYERKSGVSKQHGEILEWATM